MSRRDVLVLKLGSSVLPSDDAVGPCVHEIYRHVRRGTRVVAVVSAIGDTTDRLEARVRALAPDPDDAALAAFVATGEARAVAALTLALDAAGVPARGIDARELDLRSRGERLDAEPYAVDTSIIERSFEDVDVVVAPGFVGIHDDGQLSLLGRGGSDLTAIRIAHALDARCRLVKDVDGWFEDDPRRAGTPPRRFSRLSFDDALAEPAPIVQDKSVRHAKELGKPFEVAALGSTTPTLVSERATRLEKWDADDTRTRVTVLGCGSVGNAVVRHLLIDDRYEVARILVRDADRARPGIPQELLTDDVEAALSEPSDLVVELLGGTDLADRCIRRALREGRSVVTANKALLSRDGAALGALARAGGAVLAGSASVGGAVPMLETVQRLAANGGIRRLRGVVNGTCNDILDSLARGIPYPVAVAAAQERGFAESDPTADVSGADTAQKAVLLARAAFGTDPVNLAVSGIERCVESETRPGLRRRLVASVTAEAVTVDVEWLPIEDPLASTRNESCALEITTSDGSTAVIRGRGAGGLATSLAVCADLDDVRSRHTERAPLPTAAHPASAGAQA